MVLQSKIYNTLQVNTYICKHSDPNVPLNEKGKVWVNNMNAGMVPIEYLSNKQPLFKTAIEMIPLNP